YTKSVSWQHYLHLCLCIWLKKV
ncbi:transposase, partial [Shigella boydii]|nr:transposase [Shigella boydii]